MAGIYLVMRNNGDDYEGSSDVPLLAFDHRGAAQIHADRCQAEWLKLVARLEAWRAKANELYWAWEPYNRARRNGDQPTPDQHEAEVAAWNKMQAWEKKKPKLRTRYDKYVPEDTRHYSLRWVRKAKS